MGEKVEIVEGNSNLHMSRYAKEDEYYIDITLIGHELKYYNGNFRNKIIFCNCDNPYESNLHLGVEVERQ